MEVEKTCLEKFQNEDKVVIPDTLPDHLQTCIDSIIKREAFIQHEITSRAIPTSGGSYLGDLYDVTIKGQTKSGYKELNIFIKKSVETGQDFSSFFSVTKAYETESYVYKELSKIFNQLENDADIPMEERFKIVKGYDESTTQALILENIAKQGYRTLDRMKMIPLKFAELSIQQLAKLHSLSFVIQKRMPDYFERNILNYENAMNFNEQWRISVRTLMELTAKFLSSDYKMKAEALLSTLIENQYQYFVGDDSTRVLCHGDYRANNIMVKKSEGEITDVIAVDYQIVHYGNPVNDLLYFIHGCTDREFRRQHMKNLLNLYYDSMTNYLRYFDIDVGDVYPRKEFDESINKREDMGLIIALSYYYFFYAPENNAPNVSDGFDSYKMELDGKIARRIEEFFEELEESVHRKSTQTLD